MYKIYVLVVAICMSFSMMAQGWRDGEMEIKAFPTTANDYSAIASLNVSHDVCQGYTTLYLTPKEFEHFSEFGISFEIADADLNASAKAFWLENSLTDDAYHTVSEIIEIADGLIADYPNIVSNTIWGESVGGVDLYCLKISDNPNTDENEPEVMFDAGIHGNEIGASENVIRFAVDLCEKYGTDPEVTELIDTREIFLYLMVNPDGRTNDTRYNNNGVDLNREWGYMWWHEGNSPAPYSQQESKALRNCLLDNQFVVHTTYHSGTEYISCPWSYASHTPPDEADILDLAGIYASTSGYASMPYGQGATGMYQIFGASKDVNYGIMGSISWSMEISYDKHPPASQIMTFYNYNYPAMLAMIEKSGVGVNGLVTEEGSNTPIAATVWVDNKMMSYTDPLVGDYHKYVLPGTYDITVKANGYQTKTISNVVVTADNSTTTNFELVAEEHQNIYKLITAVIPNGNLADPSETWNIIGQADGDFYSLGKDGYVVVDMQTIILDGSGNDIRVHEGDASAEGYEVFASPNIDGPWTSIGTGSGTTEFNLGSAGAARFLKIVDDGDGSASVVGAGFDLDAIESLSNASGAFISINSVEYDILYGAPFDIDITVKNIGSEEALNVTGTLTSSDTYVTINTTAAQSYGNINMNATSEATFSITLDENAPAGHIAQFEVEFEGDNVSNLGSFSIEFPDYCLPTGTNCTLGDEIDDFTFADISNLGSGCSPDGYGDFLSITGNVTAGETYDATFTCSYANESVSLWIDLDGDMDFETDELLIEDLDCATSGQSYTAQVVIPASATPITTRLRIRCNWNASSADPCVIWSYGETEDYTVVIGADGVFADFSADNTMPCAGDDVQFSDESTGTISTYEWSFEGGTPSFSNDENPVVSYGTVGSYDVSLTVTGPDGTNTKTEENYILAVETPEVPAMPSGDTGLCQDNEDSDYETEEIAGVSQYIWSLAPPTAGTIQNNGSHSITIDWYADYSGDVDLKVKAQNSCGMSANSDALNITLSPLPEKPMTPEGVDIACTAYTTDFQDDFTIDPAANADTYIWKLEPSDAGVISGSGTTGTAIWTDAWTGTVEISVKGVNECGEGVFSDKKYVECEVCSGINSLYKDSFSMFPNPSTGLFQLKCYTNDDNYEVAIFDLAGQIIVSEKLSGNENNINLSAYAEGVYFVSITTNKGRFIQKLVLKK